MIKSSNTLFVTILSNPWPESHRQPSCCLFPCLLSLAIFTTAILDTTRKNHHVLHSFFSWLWCITFFTLAIWSVHALITLQNLSVVDSAPASLAAPAQTTIAYGTAAYGIPAQPNVLSLDYASTIITLTLTVGLCLLGATFLRHRYPNWLGPVQLISSWAIYPALRVIHQAYPLTEDKLLYTLDLSIWGGRSLPHWAKLLETPLLTEILSFCYFTFYLIVLGSAIYFAAKPSLRSRTFFYGLLLIYLFGILGYVAIPASGPYIAYPHEFPSPAGGAFITHALVYIVSLGITGMDAFPSLHCAVTLFILGFLALNGYHKAALLITPLFIGITFATVYLRYHYGIDLIAGIALALVVLYYIQQYQKQFCLITPNASA